MPESKHSYTGVIVAPYACEICGRRTSSIYRLVYPDGDVWACGACADLREDGSDE